MIEKELLDILACPETKKSLQLAEQEVIDKLNQSIKERTLRNRSQEVITDEIDGGLYREGDRQFVYPIRNGIPILLIDELISTDNI